jgi:hypothetical protein
MSPTELDDLIDAGAAENGNLAGTLADDEPDAATVKTKSPVVTGLSARAGDRGRTGDVQLGKLRKGSTRKR